MTLDKSNMIQNIMRNMILIKGQSFMMRMESMDENVEQSNFLFNLSSFYLAKYPVTQGEWFYVMGVLSQFISYIKVGYSSIHLLAQYVSTLQKKAETGFSGLRILGKIDV
jgi:hypothetical protein